MLAGPNVVVPGLQNQTGFSVLQATTDELRECVYRFRYHVYVDHMKRRQIHADDTIGIIKEPMDDRGLNYLAVKDGVVIGCIRRNLADDETAKYYRSLYKSDMFNAHCSLDKISFTTKLMMKPEFRGSRYSVELIRAYASDGYRDGICVDIIDCNKPLIPFFERIGYHSYRGWAFHKEYGTIRPMFLAADDLQNLRARKSFLYAEAEKYVSHNQYRGVELTCKLAQ